MMRANEHCRSRARPLALAAALLAWLPVACRTAEEARVGVTYYDAPRLPRDLLTVTVSDGGAVRELRGDRIGRPGEPAPELPTRRAGTLRVAFRFAAGGATVSEGAAEVPLRGDWRYGFDIMVDSLDPTRACFGCIGRRAFPLPAEYRRSPRDSVWLVWGGNSIRNPVIY